MASRSTWARFFPFTDLKGYRAGDVSGDLTAAVTLSFIAIPQSVAYAMIAGLPPAMGLYAAAVPTIVGSLFRSSRHVITGPTNALSLLVGTAGAAAAGLDPVPTALLLAFLVGVIQVSAGVLRLGALVDYISIPVVIGYITGAGVLIGVGQLRNLTETEAGRGNLFETIYGWTQHLSEANVYAVGVAFATLIGIIVLRRINKKIPGTMLMLALMTLLSWLFDVERFGLSRIVDLSPVPAGFPPLSLPLGEGTYAWSFDNWLTIFPIAIAATVLSLVESSSLGRALSARTGQRLDLSVEFVGQGLANVTAAFFGGYPVSGSLSRSALNYESGATSRLAGVFNGFIMLGVLLALGPAVDHTPIASLAGLLLVVAYDLVDVPKIREILRGRRSDGAAFAATVLGTWVLRLDHAIYLGVALSVFLFLRRARLITVHELVFDEEGRPMELRRGDPLTRERGCSAIRMIQVEGELFFGAASELMSALDDAIDEEGVKVVWLRIRRAFGMDISIAQTLVAASERLRAEGRHLVVVGVREPAYQVLERTGAIGKLGEENVLRRTDAWFDASDRGLLRALDLVGEHECHEPCPIEAHLKAEDATPSLIDG